MPNNFNNPFQELLHKDHKFEYYKVAAVEGMQMTSCNVVKTCLAVGNGMKAVCEGQRYEQDTKNNRLYSCFGANEKDCYVTPFSDKPHKHSYDRHHFDHKYDGV